MAPYSVIKEKNIANVSTDRIIKLTPMSDSDSRTNRRSTASNIFQGDKQLHAVQESGLWILQYKSSQGSLAGNLPEPLKQKWTNFNQLMKYVTSYFASRNIAVEEIIA